MGSAWDPVGIPEGSDAFLWDPGFRRTIFYGGSSERTVAFYNMNKERRYENGAFWGDEHSEGDTHAQERAMIGRMDCGPKGRVLEFYESVLSRWVLEFCHSVVSACLPMPRPPPM